MIPLLHAEALSGLLRTYFERDQGIIVWWFSEIECASALARLERDGVLTGRGLKDAYHQLDSLRKVWSEIDAVSALRRNARRLVRVHNLRAADAGQLAAALVASEGSTEALEFVCIDRRLNAAAEREGFVVPQFTD